MQYMQPAYHKVPNEIRWVGAAMQYFPQLRHGRTHCSTAGLPEVQCIHELRKETKRGQVDWGLRAVTILQHFSRH